ncbi:MAG: class I SAM-dependent methyltransferase [Gorillibacterium sp.]|nr:class I SAM-dependent methyltransferase [Gorillibacterium sp.]
MGFASVLSFARKLIEERIERGEPAVDATAGNGVDTLFLAKASGRKGTIYAFDIQEKALDRTRQRLSAENGISDVHVMCMSHHLMEDVVPACFHGKVAAIMFNLGYLPDGEDKDVITQTDTTLLALEAALRLLRANGIITIVLYPGHPGGAEETDAVIAWANDLPMNRFDAMIYRFVNRDPNAAYLLAIIKRHIL